VVLDERAEPQVPAPAIAERAADRAASPASSDQAFRLRAAAAAGRATEVEGLLAQGVPVDAPDAAGETALMKSVQADHPAAAAVLRRHGASLDRRNRLGESARDMAAAKADPALDRALGLGP
jgi:ankyrin repeat protein